MHTHACTHTHADRQTHTDIKTQRHAHTHSHTHTRTHTDTHTKAGSELDEREHEAADDEKERIVGGIIGDHAAAFQRHKDIGHECNDCKEVSRTLEPWQTRRCLCVCVCVCVCMYV